MNDVDVHNRPFSWEFVLAVIENRLGMWVSPDTYESAVNLVTGFDMAQRDSIHPVLQARVAERHGATPIVWSAWFIAEVLGDEELQRWPPRERTDDEERALRGHLARECRAAVESMRSKRT